MAFEQDDSHIIGEINITPLTDVMLVLLIMFLLTATFILSSRGLRVDLPAPVVEHEPPPEPDPAARIVVQVDRQGRVHIGGRPLADGELTGALMEEAARRRDREKIVVVRAHADAPYGRVIWIMDSARLVGLPRVSLATEEPEPGAGSQ